jgi:hypothetical protein
MADKAVITSGPLAGYTIEPVQIFTAAQHRVLALLDADRLGYLKAQDEWTDGDEPLPDDMQDAANSLFEGGWLPEFEEA